MLAAKLEGNKKITLVEMDTPKANGTDVIIKVDKVGICGSDIHMWEIGDQFKGLIMGHEYSGTVVDPGNLKGTLNIGDRVTSIPLSPCMECEYCKNGLHNICAANANSPGVHTPGAYAEYFAARYDLVRKLPDNISDDEAAMIEPAAVALHAVRETGMKSGDKLLITGAGVIGAMVAAWAHYLGASYIAVSEVNKSRADKMKAFGDVDEVFDGTDSDLVPKLVKASGGGFDRFIDCSGAAPAINTGILSLKKGAVAGLVGINLNLVPFTLYMTVMKAIRLQGILAYTLDEFDEALRGVSEKKIDIKRFHTATYPLYDIDEAFERVSAKDATDLKIILSI